MTEPVGAGPGRKRAIAPQAVRDRGRVDQLVSVMPGSAALPRQNGELVFDAPWESRAFGLAVALHGAGHFQWEEFQHRLIEDIAAWEAGGGELTAWSYYERWVSTFERLLVDKGICSPGDLAASAAVVRAHAADDDHRDDGHGEHGDHRHRHDGQGDPDPRH